MEVGTCADDRALFCLSHPNNLLNPPAQLLVGQLPHDLDVRVTIEGLGRELAHWSSSDGDLRQSLSSAVTGSCDEGGILIVIEDRCARWRDRTIEEDKVGPAAFVEVRLAIFSTSLSLVSG